ncbi:hypothetical protein GCM10009677_09110 [Sphaerisporangium rubeum]
MDAIELGTGGACANATEGTNATAREEMTAARRTRVRRMCKRASRDVPPIADTAHTVGPLDSFDKRTLLVTYL